MPAQHSKCTKDVGDILSCFWALFCIYIRVFLKANICSNNFGGVHPGTYKPKQAENQIKLGFHAFLADGHPFEMLSYYTKEMR